MNKVGFGLTLAIIIFSSCATLKDDERLLIESLDTALQSKLLADKGAEFFTLELEKNEAYNEIGRIRKYFEAALRLDPENTKARSYLGKLDSFIQDTLKSKIQTARALLKKKKRTEAENYNLAVTVRRLSELDPNNWEVRAISGSSESIIRSLFEKYLKAARSARSGFKPEDSEPKKEKALLGALSFYDSALLIADSRRNLQAEREEVLSGLRSIVESRINTARSSIKAGRYLEAERLAASAFGLDSKTGRRYAGESARLSYELYYGWSLALFRAKNYKSAGITIERALFARKTGEAQSLKSQIERITSESDEAAKFDAWISEIDDSIKAGDFPGAYWKGKTALSRVKDKDRIGKITSRVEKIESEFPRLYGNAVELYKAEEFADAIEILEVIVDALGDYDDARAYLERARSKQSILDTFAEKDETN